MEHFESRGTKSSSSREGEPRRGDTGKQSAGERPQRRRSMLFCKSVDVLDCTSAQDSSSSTSKDVFSTYETHGDDRAQRRLEKDNCQNNLDEMYNIICKVKDDIKTYIKNLCYELVANKSINLSIEKINFIEKGGVTLQHKHQNLGIDKPIIAHFEVHVDLNIADIVKSKMLNDACESIKDLDLKNIAKGKSAVTISLTKEDKLAAVKDAMFREMYRSTKLQLNSKIIPEIWVNTWNALHKKGDERTHMAEMLKFPTEKAIEAKKKLWLNQVSKNYERFDTYMDKQIEQGTMSKGEKEHIMLNIQQEHKKLKKDLWGWTNSDSESE